MGATIYLPNLCSIAMHKGELAYCLNITQANEKFLQRVGYSKYDKILMPVAVNVILGKSGLQIDQEKLAEVLGKTVVRLV